MSDSEQETRNKLEEDNKKSFNDQLNMIGNSQPKSNPLIEDLPTEGKSDEKEEKQAPVEEQKFTISKTKKNDKEEIDRDYELKFGKAPGKENGGTSYAFKSDQEAVDFFKSQSEKGRSFQVYKRGEDKCMYSDGEHFVRGTIAQVEEWKKDHKAFNIGENGALEKINPEAKNETSNQRALNNTQQTTPMSAPLANQKEEQKNDAPKEDKVDNQEFEVPLGGLQSTKSTESAKESIPEIKEPESAKSETNTNNELEESASNGLTK